MRSITFILQPVLITLILEYIQNLNENKEIYYGLALVIIYNILDVISIIIMEQSEFLQAVIGINAKHGIVGIIYNKVLKISQATNKQFSQGEIMNFINVDAEKISNISANLSNAARLPFQVIFSLWFLFYYLEFSLFASIGWGVIFTFINYLIGIIRGYIQRKIYFEKDRRMTVTNEAICNIKTIKINSFINIFINKIQNFRNKELFYIKLSILIELIGWFLGWILSSGLFISGLLLFYLSGNNISVPKAFATMQIFRTLEVPVKWVPVFVNSILEFMVSANRINLFLIWKEINPQLVSKDIRKNLDLKTISIENACFTWGGPRKAVSLKSNAIFCSNYKSIIYFI